MAPIADVLRDRWLEWISAARLPMRTGTHGNTAFATGLVFDAAQVTGDFELASACIDAALRWHRDETAYGGFEPDAADFLSPALTTADLMRRALDTAGIRRMARRLSAGAHLGTVARAARTIPGRRPERSLRVTFGRTRVVARLELGGDRGRIAGRAPVRRLARTASAAHRQAGWTYVFGGHGYMADHWLGTFAAYLDVKAL